MNNLHVKTCKELCAKFEQIQRKRHCDLRTVFDDFCRLATAAYHNAPYSFGKYPVPNFYEETCDKLEQEYKNIIDQYGDSGDLFSDILATLQKAMFESPFDYLGRLYADMNINSRTAGQFFTPPHLCGLMAQMAVGDKDSFEKLCEDKGYVSVSDPTCGSGAMAIALAKVLKNYGIKNLDTKLYIELTDIDYICAKMAFIQMSAMNLSARIVWGDALRDEKHAVFDTPCLQIALAVGLFGNSSTSQTLENELVQAKTRNDEKGQIELLFNTEI
jgi:type I restriction-modification system DNA methylase subunit